MKEIQGNIWDYHDRGYWVIVTTNGVVKRDGSAVMGRGIALQCKKKFPGIDKDLGRTISKYGNVLLPHRHLGIVFFPTKHHWREKSDPALIEKGCRELKYLFDNQIMDYPTPIYLVRLGCSNGQLEWEDVEPILDRYLDDRFVVVNREE